MHLIIFKTNVATQEEVKKLQSLLSALPPVTQCNFDLDDCDSILRIVIKDLQPKIVCQLLQKQGFHCEPMESFDYHL